MNVPIELSKLRVKGVIKLTKLSNPIVTIGLSASQVLQIAEQTELTEATVPTELTAVTVGTEKETEKEHGLNAMGLRVTEVTLWRVGIWVIAMVMMKFATVKSVAIGLKRLQWLVARVNQVALAADVTQLLLAAEVEHLMKSSYTQVVSMLPWSP